jgi:Zn-finger nucleic acid-binding protein
MIRMVDRHQPHIWYESCPVCFGIYMDAGEFREQKQRPIVSVIRDMFHHQERP